MWYWYLLSFILGMLFILFLEACLFIWLAKESRREKSIREFERHRAELRKEFEK